MIDKDYNLLPLDTWRRILGWNPWHFWGLYADVGNAKVTSQCLDIVTEYAWQDVDSAGREEIRQAIISAEAMIRRWTGFWPAPTYVESAARWPSHYRVQPDWHRIGVQLPDTMIQAIGVESRVLIGQATIGTGTLVYSDALNSGLDDTFTITLPVPPSMPTLTADQVAVYLGATDRTDGAALSERWRVAPVSVTISGGVITIIGRRWLVVRPLAYEGMDGEGLDATDPTNFVSSLDVYRRVTDPDGQTLDDCQSVIEWETRPCHGRWCACGCNGSQSGDPAAVAMTIARAGIRNREQGIVIPAGSVYDSTSGQWRADCNWWCNPDRVRVRVLAGQPLQDGAMQSQWAQAVTRLAAAELSRPICACDSANKELYRWQFDLATATSEAEQYQVDFGDLANPLGTRRGHVSVWKLIARSEIVRGFTPG